MAEEKVNSGILNIDGVAYSMDQLSVEASNQVTNLRGTDMEISRLKQQLAIMQTARVAYASALKQALPEVTVA